MAVIPIIQQTWDTTSYVNPTRMNNIETNLGILSKATGIEYSAGVSVKDKIDEVDGKTADDIPYSTGVSVKDKIDDVDDKIDGLIKKQTFSITIPSGQTGAIDTRITYDRIISVILVKNDDIFYNPIIYSLQNYGGSGLIEGRTVPAGTGVSSSRTYNFIVVYI